MKLVRYPDTPQFRQVVRDISRESRFVGLDNDGNAIYDSSLPLPKVVCHGTVKLHGTQSAVSYNTLTKEFWSQSRENIINPLKDNAGFAFFVESNKDVFLGLVNQVTSNNNESGEYVITIYGEWAGKGIQKGVAISEVDKSFYIFGVKISKPHVEDFSAYWVDYSYLRSPDNRIFNVLDYKTYEVDVDFNFPELSQNKFVDIVSEVEKECPIAKTFGISGIGEGVVFTINHNNRRYIFKCKGEKHSVSKVKTVAAVDVDKVNSAREFADYSVTKPRVEQGIQKVCGSIDNIDVKKTGEFINWIMDDIVKEESDTISENNLEVKDVSKYIKDKARKMFMEYLNVSV